MSIHPDVEPNGVRLHQANEPDIPQIPTTDPQAALRFCQALSNLIENAKPYLNFNAVIGGEFQVRPTLSVVTPVYNEQENLPYSGVGL